MKRLLMVVALGLASVLMAQDKTLSLANARSKIGDVISDARSAGSVIGQLSAEDQVKFLADVNAAITKMPGSIEEKTAKYLDVNSAALRNAQKGNLTALVAEVFATVPPEALTVINERFAADQFNRAADPAKVYTDDEFTDIAKKLFAKVQERDAKADNSGVRDTFAILMLLRASNGTPANLRETLVNEIKDPEVRKLAQEEWISPALGIGQDKTYDPLLGAAGTGKQPDPQVVMALSFADTTTALLGDLTTDGLLKDSARSVTAQFDFLESDTYNGLDRVPRPRRREGVLPVIPVIPSGGTPVIPPYIPPEPGPYGGQSISK